MQRLVPRALALARQCAALNIQLTIDAEEADRLDLSLDVIEALAKDAATRDWAGLGLAVQAYGKRALQVIDWVAAACRQYGRRMTVRLVKGAYWDSEIKRAQERGLAGYPVYTRKVTTDVSYLACAGRLFSYADVIYSQFATHNAHSIASVLELAPPAANYEFQRLHGMGRLLYAEAARQVANFPRVRVYAPVGEHKDLLAYLVRRLLENGANTSFVNRFMDEQVPVAEIVRDPIAELERLESYAHARLPIPGALYSDRRNSRGTIWAIHENCKPCATSCRRMTRRRPRMLQPPARLSTACWSRAASIRSPIRRTGASRSVRRGTRHRMKSSWRSMPAPLPSPRGIAAAAGRARVVWKKPRICSKSIVRISTGCWCGKRARPSRMPSPRCEKPSIFAATTHCARASNLRRRNVSRGPPAS